MTQNEMVLGHMQKAGSITQAEAYAYYGCTRLAAIIYDLKQGGARITSVVEVGNNRFGMPVHYSRYILAPEQAA